MRYAACLAPVCWVFALVPTVTLSLIFLGYSTLADEESTIGHPLVDYELINGILSIFGGGFLTLAIFVAAALLACKGGSPFGSGEMGAVVTWTLMDSVAITFALYAFAVGVPHVIFGIWYSTLDFAPIAAVGATFPWWFGPVRLIVGAVQVIAGALYVVFAFYEYTPHRGAGTYTSASAAPMGASHDYDADDDKSGGAANETGDAYDPVATTMPAGTAHAPPPYGAPPQLLTGGSTYQRMAAAARGATGDAHQSVLFDALRARD